MKNIKYFFEFLLIFILFFIFRVVGYKTSSSIGYIIGKTFGPIFRSKKVIIENIKNFNSLIKEDEINKILKTMWGNYGRILAEYPYISHISKNSKKYFIFFISI